MRMVREARAISLILLALFLFLDANAQKPRGNSRRTAVRLQTLILHSKLLARDVSYRVILPARYGVARKSESFPTVYLLHGLSGDFGNWTDRTKLKEYASEYDFIIVTPEGKDGWYTDSASIPNDRFETYITQELIPEVDKKFGVKSSRHSRAIAGLSMGGYGAIKFGLKYPEMFSLVGSFSGALDAPLRGKQNQFLRPSLVSVFGDEESQTRRANDIFFMIAEITPEKIANLPFVFLSCGTEDSFYAINRDFANLLQRKGIAHEYRELPGKHDWAFWDGQVREFLRLSEKFLK